MMSPQERAVALVMMRQASDAFYYDAVKIGNHAFIEFAGLMNEYIKICEQTHAEGIDFTDTNIHCGQKPVVRSFNLSYIEEKLNCIFETSCDVSVKLKGESDADKKNSD